VKVLIAVDSSDVAQRAVVFAGKILAGRNDVEVTLFHVVESIPEFVLAESKQGGSMNALRLVADEWAESNRLAGERLLAAQREALTRAGVPATCVHERLAQKESRPESCRVVAALAIIDEMKRENYDVVVIGRRGTSSTIPTLMGGVAEKVAREAFGRTLWVVD